MPMTVTFPTITFPNRGELVRDDFVIAQETAQDLLGGSFTTALATFKTEANALETNVNAKEVTVVAKEALVSPHYGSIDTTAGWINAGFPTVLNSVNMMIDTIATLRTTLYSGQQIVSVTGYYTAADNIGVREYYWDALSVEADNGGTIIQVTGVVTGRWKMKYSGAVNVKWFGAKGDWNGTTGTDDYLSIQAACDFIYASGGGIVSLPDSMYLSNTPIRLQSNTNLQGSGKESTTIVKDSTTTKLVTIVAGAGVVYPGVLPSNINAVIILDGSVGRYIGKISDLTVKGTLTTIGDYESQKVEFGIVSIGSVSDFTLENVYVLTANFGWYFPNIFASTITNNRVSNCLTGSGIELGTSLTYTSNYMNSCRDVGHYIRSLKYSLISSNACDALNRSDFYPTRTRVCVAYWLRSLIGCTVTSNGDEGTLGRSYYLNVLDNCTVEGNTTIAIGSDYVGAEEIAWHYTDGVLRCCRIENNTAYSVNSNGLLFGGAVAGNHHNIYFASKTNFLNTQYQDNIVRTALSAITEAGWLNNINKPSDYIEEGVFTPVMAGLTTAGTGTYVAQYGSYTKVGKRVFFTLRLSWSAHTGTGNMVIDGLPYASANISKNEAAVTIGWVQTVLLTAGNVASGYINSNSTQILLEQYATGGGSTSAIALDPVAGFMISGSYLATV